jgi:hypothetical protein
MATESLSTTIPPFADGPISINWGERMFNNPNPLAKARSIYTVLSKNLTFPRLLASPKSKSDIEPERAVKVPIEAVVAAKVPDTCTPAPDINKEPVMTADPLNGNVAGA